MKACQTDDPYSSLDPQGLARQPFLKVWQAGLCPRRSRRYVLNPFCHGETSDAFQSLQHKRVLSIDLAAIMAGSGIRGQFEEKFKALLRDIEDEVGPILSTSAHDPPPSRFPRHSVLSSPMGTKPCPPTVLTIEWIGRERDLFHRRSS